MWTEARSVPAAPPSLIGTAVTPFLIRLIDGAPVCRVKFLTRRATLVAMGWDETYDARGQAVMRAALSLAKRSGVVSPVHLLVAVAEAYGPVHDLLTDRLEGLRGALAATDTGSVEEDLPPGYSYGVTFDPYSQQAGSSAQSWAGRRGEKISPEHLAVVLIDQGTPEVLDALGRAGADHSALRRVALGAIGAPVDQAAMPLVALPAAGVMGRPPLPIAGLHAGAWEELCRRQDRLPLGRLHIRISDWHAIGSNESRAVSRLADRLGLDDDQRYSLLRHHHDEVQRRAAVAAPEVVGPPRSPLTISRPIGVMVHSIGHRRRHRHLIPGGWICWFGNRRVNLRARWLRLTVQH